MQPTHKPRIKICCISSTQEAQLAMRYGASALGLVSSMPSGPGVIAEDLIAEIAVRIPLSVSSKMKKTITEVGVYCEYGLSSFKLEDMQYF